MQQIIVISNGQIDGHAVQTVNARDLHSSLKVAKDFSSWIKAQVKRARLLDGRDFTTVTLLGVGGQFNTVDYHLTIGAAKHIAMMSGTDKGFEVRDYFIECERRALQATTPIIPQSLSSALRLAADQAEQIEQQQAQLAIAAPKAAFVDSYVESTGLKGFRQVAKLLKANEARLREFLDGKIMYLLGGEWHAYQQHIDAGRFSVKTGTNAINNHTFSRSLFTPKGVEWLAGLWAVHCLNGGAA